MRVGLVVTATGKYIEYAFQLANSARRRTFFGKNFGIIVFTDNPIRFFRIENFRTAIEVPKKPWPHATLMRYHFLLQAAGELDLSEFDYLFQCDADMRFVEAGEEILGDLVAVQHPGFYEKHRAFFSYERRIASTAGIMPNEGTTYYAGGFQGGRTETFLRAARCIADNIDADTANGITAVWHDESHWNRYLVDNPPDVVLDPGYCYPEELTLPFEPKLLALLKDHAAMRA